LAVHDASPLFATSYKTQIAIKDVCNHLCTNRITATNADYFEVMTDVLTEPALGQQAKW
jgi:hypothetical protein